jgi:hypothetical protein
MEQAETKSTPIKRSREEILQLISEYKKSSGLTIKAFCQLKGISEGLFYSYQSRYRSGKQRSNKSGSFIAITPQPPKESNNKLFAEVKGIKIYQVVPAEYLKALVS